MRKIASTPLSMPCLSLAAEGTADGCPVIHKSRPGKRSHRCVELSVPIAGSGELVNLYGGVHSDRMELSRDRDGFDAKTNNQDPNTAKTTTTATTTTTADILTPSLAGMGVGACDAVYTSCNETDLNA